ncbi:MAG: LuxR C-terminal-related transcriptional regulator [Dehalococcoidia bacterium]
MARQLTLISAPAGFGKTTLLAEWLASTRHADRRVAWLSLDESDSVPSAFWSYFFLALRSVQPGIAEMLLPMIHAPQPQPIQSILTILINEVSALDDPFTLVLDDYHVIASQPVHEALAFLVDHLPAQMDLLIATRADPPLPLARLRARRELNELRASDLRFTQDEVAAFFREVIKLNLNVEDVQALDSRTEGWIAALQLAALSMEGRDDASSFVRSFAGDDRYIVDYLIEEVLQWQAEPVRKFLLRTSVLGRLNASLCDALIGGHDSRVMLADLERQNMFLVPLDDRRRWYRYHHLFADVLQAHLQEEYPAELPVLQTRASDWYEANGLREEAIRHALAAQDYDRAARLIELAWPEMDRSFMLPVWLTWIRALPEALLEKRPVLGVDYAWALLDTGEMDAGIARLEDAERSLSHDNIIVADEEHFASLRASIEMARAYQAQVQGDPSATVIHAERALEALPEEDLVRRGVIDALLALAYWTRGDLEPAYRSLADGTATFEKAGSIHFAISGTFILADIRLLQGRLSDATAVYERALKTALAKGEPPIRGTADIYLGLSELHRERSEDGAAEAYLKRCEELDESAGQVTFRYRWCLAKARERQSRGDLAGALEYLDWAEDSFVAGPLPDVRPVGALRARIWARQGELDLTSRWIRDRQLDVDDELSFLREAEHITLARILLARYRAGGDEASVRQAISLLTRLLVAATQGGRNRSAIEVLLLLSLAGRARGDIAGALAALRQAIALAEPEGFVRAFVDEGEPMRELLRHLAGEATSGAYGRRLLAAFDGVRASEDRSAVPSALMDPLTGRELEILRLVAAGLTNQQIADQLVISVATVKRHIANAYSKLGAGHRTEAVARANELKLI